MKKVSKNRQEELVGGATHYHWFCNVNNYRGAKSNTYAGAEDGVMKHLSNQPSHVYNTYVIKCTGNC